MYVDLTTGNDRTFHALMPAPPPQVAELMARLGVTSYDAFYVSQIAMFGRLREHGVAVVTGVDSGMGPMKRHGNAWRTVGELVGWLPRCRGPRGCDIGGRGGVRTRRETGRLAEEYAADVLVVDGELAQGPLAAERPARFWSAAPRSTSPRRVRSPAASWESTADSAAQAAPSPRAHRQVREARTAAHEEVCTAPC